MRGFFLHPTAEIAARKVAKREKRRLRNEERERKRKEAEEQQKEQQPPQEAGAEPEEQQGNASKKQKMDKPGETAAAAVAAADGKGNAHEAQHIRQVLGFTGPSVKQQQGGSAFTFDFEAAKEQELQQKLDRIMAVDAGQPPPSTYVPCRVSRGRREAQGGLARVF